MTIYNPGLLRLLGGQEPFRAAGSAPPVQACTDGRGRVYYHAGITTAYYGPEGPCIPGGSGAENYSDLSRLEWDINDLHMGAEASDLVPGLHRALALVRAWQEQMERDFPQTPFDIYLSVSDGSEAVEESEPCAGVNIHFYAVREGRALIRREQMDGDYAQPALLLQVNRKENAEKENRIC